MVDERLLAPNWPAPDNIVALATTRCGVANFSGASVSEYSQFNLGDHVDDSPASVEKNRKALLATCDGLSSIAWLQQVHGVDVCKLPFSPINPTVADASITAETGLACAVLTADCLPVLFCRVDGGEVAAAHAGWRGLCNGMLKNTVDAFGCSPQQLMAWTGPAISQAHFEVGPEVYQAFLDGFGSVTKEQIDSAFKPSVERSGYFYADLRALAHYQLQGLGLAWVGGTTSCTYQEAERFYSYRRDGKTGRQASLIYRR
ncbi:Polyphenol oxidase [Zhongshania aliphaticivorans]|uniref:Purine nucleoside phosphorylase n=1 Tax=Zhongshania aliphaticivorans TaxID=1470434 RepID=A0A5S9QHP3_9GAMM|nr:peptidoglycan editing factor PgeF [Zhongshania aliphaticivorans]CAA0109327.1 Polyphenol oxidase [Zhongshania aliphaticivorans]CAA0117556.1 Polyphenol oxidase [Zhongshania aliphaticivorans]